MSRRQINRISRRINRIDRKCDRILSEISALRHSFRSDDKELDEVIDRLHRTARVMHESSEHERRLISDLMRR